jgi:hypothetical protein
LRLSQTVEVSVILNPEPINEFEQLHCLRHYPDLVTLVDAKIKALSQYNTIRFRSSTNSEDLEGFNGAGLYESYSAELDNPKKTIGNAIKQVYASMWTFEDTYTSGGLTGLTL